MSKFTRLGSLPGKTKTGPKKGKHEATYSLGSIDSLDSKKQSITKLTPITTSPYSFACSQSVKSLNKISIQNKIRLKKDQKLRGECDKSPIIGLKNKHYTSFSFLSIEEVAGHEEKENALTKDEEILEKLMSIKEVEKKFKAVISAFDQILQEKIPYNKALLFIKTEYDSNILKLTSEIEENKVNIYELEKCNKFLSNELQKLMSIHKKTSTDYQDLYTKYTKVSNSLIKASNINFEELEKTDKNWKKLLKQNKLYEHSLCNLTEDLEYYKGKAQKLRSILLVFEKEGFKVKEIYETKVKDKKSIRNVGSKEEVPDDTDYEDLCSGKAKVGKRPGEVPRLELTEVVQSSNRTCLYNSESVSSEISIM